MPSTILIAICQQLLASGKTPSVALVKAKAPKNTPLPDIISLVQRVKQDPKAWLKAQPSDVQVSPEVAVTAATEDDKINALEARIASLEARLNALEQQRR